MDDAPLHKQFYKSLFEPDYRLKGQARYAQDVAKFRRMMRDAEHFELDHRAIETIMDKGAEYQFMMDRTQIAHLPFDTVWLEYDCHHKVRYSQKIGLAAKEPLIECPRKLGFLIKRAEGRPDAWVAFMIMSMGEGELELPYHGILPICFLFDANSTKPIVRLAGLRAYSQAGLLASPYAEEHDVADIQYADKMIGSHIWGVNPNGEFDQFDEVNNVAAVSLTEMWQMAAEYMLSEGEIELWLQIIEEALYEHRGAMRFLVTALALINHVPIVYKTSSGKRGAFRTKHGIQPYFTHRTVSIDFAKVGRKSITTMLQAAAKEARRRAHKVRRYMRSIRDAAGRIIGEKWIEAHTRGDPRLGWVHHDYEVTDSR